MKEPWQMTDKELEAYLDSGDEEFLDEAYDELDRRRHDRETMDWTEQDEMAAWSERYELWRREY